jgi:formiminotetrahydrofolate cyclodeaminase
MEMKDFLEKLASDSPTPGGGSASAASGAIGAALLSMVYSISRKKIMKTLEKHKEEILNALNEQKKSKSIESRDLLREQETQNILVEKFSKSADEAKKVMNKLLLLVNEDANAYESVVEKLKNLKKLRNLKETEGEIEIDYSKAEINNRKEKKDNNKIDIEINKSKEDLQKAYKDAAEVPFQVAKLCHRVLKNSKNLASKVISPVKSDFQIAISLLKVGIEGAALNVNLNLKEIDDKNFVNEKRKELNKILKD